MGKTAYIVRGLPGSGKTTLARTLAGENWTEADRFMVDAKGNYQFDPKRLPNAHNRCFDEFCELIDAGIETVAVSNTFTRRWEYERYVVAAHDAGYTVEIVSPDTPWAWDVDELSNRNTHNVPRLTIQAMLDRWEK